MTHSGGIRRFDRTVRCEVQIRQRDEELAVATFETCGWRHRRIAPGRFEVNIVVVGSRLGAARRARAVLLDGLRRCGLVADLRSTIRRDVPFQRGDRLPVYRVKQSRWPWTERLRVALGGRDTGHEIEAATVAEAERELLHARNELGDDPDPLAWRRRFGQPRLPASARSAPQATVLVVGLYVVTLVGGVAFGMAGPGLAWMPLGAAVLAVLSWGWSKAHRAPEWAIGAVAAAGVGVYFGATTGPSSWPYWLAALAAVLAGLGVWHLLRDLSLGAQISWLLPMTLPIIVPFTAYVGDLAYGRYLNALGLTRESVVLGLWDRLQAAVLPVGLACGVSLLVLGVMGWLRYLHFQVPTLLALLVALTYLVFGVSEAARTGEAAARNPQDGFAALQPVWVCATPLDDRIPLNGGLLPTPSRPLLKLELVGGRLALWDPHARPMRDGLVKVPADKVRAVRATGEKASCGRSTS